MKYPGFVGSSNEEQGYLAGQERTVNWYVAPLAPNSPSQRALFPIPGVTQLNSVSGGAGRAHAFIAGREFAVESGTLYEISSGGIFTSRGTVATNINPATISYNGDGGGELFITSGGNGYIYTLSTDTLAQVAALNGIADQGDHIDGYFLALDFDTSTVYFSDLLDGTTWTTGTNFFQRSAASDPWVALKVLNGAYIWLFGDETSEVWYNAGTFPIPFEPHPSGRGIEYGCVSPFSPATGNGRMYWHGSTGQGRGMVLSTPGFSPDRVSSPAVEIALQGYGTTSSAIGECYDEAGHQFYLLSVPDEITWGYDASTQEWHERGTWDVVNSVYTPWRPQFHVYAFGEHRWLDAQNGAVYRSSLDTALDVNSGPIRRLRRGPPLIFENERIFFSRFELLMDVGQGVASTPAQGVDPHIALRFSDDGGNTWSTEQLRAGGKQGAYDTRVYWTRLGAARKRVFEIVASDPIPWRILDAFVDVSQPPRKLSQVQQAAWSG